jgi:hypothetical protein
MTTIINPWKDPRWGTNRDFEAPDDPVFQHGDYSIYKLYRDSWLYVYQGRAFNELAGLNKQHLIDVAEHKGNGFLYDRALENLQRSGY